MYSVMWSEHCSYKSSKVHLRRFGETTTDEMRRHLLAGIGENAGVVDVGDGWAVTFKIESHNHPSYVEPHQGAATGVGGIVRDIMAMGARPVAVMDGLRVGPLDAPDTARVLPGVVVRRRLLRQLPGPAQPRRRGRLRPDLRREPAGQRPVRRGAADRGPAPGVRVRRRATRSCCSGPGPASTASAGCRCSRARRSSGAAGGAGRKKLPSVQVGDPFAEKVLIECCLELYRGGPRRRDPGPRRRGPVLRHQRARERRRRRHGRRPRHRPAPRDGHDARRDPLQRVAGADVRGGTPENVDAFMAVCERWDVTATVIGEVTDGEHLRITAGARPSSTSRRAPSPTTARSTSARSPAPTARTRCRPRRPRAWPGRRRPRSWRDGRQLAASPGLASRAWVTEQYDRYVRGNTAGATPGDAGVLRLDESGGPGDRARRSTATPGSACSTRVRAPGSPWPSRSATSRPPGPGRSRSRTA